MRSTERLSRWSIIAIGAVVVVAALREVAAIAAPLTLALVTGVVLSPLTDLWARKGVKPVVGALASLFGVAVVIVALALIFYPVGRQFVAQAPKVIRDTQETIEEFRDMARGIEKVSEEVNEAITEDVPAAPAAVADPDAVAAEEEVPLPSLTDAVLVVPGVLAQIFVFAGALFFFMLTREEIYAFVSRRLTAPGETVQMAMRLRAAERKVSRYFLAITVVNAGLGTATAVGLQILGLPAAALWGVIVFLMNYVLYLGPALVSLALLFAGVAAFDGLPALLPMILYICFNLTEAQFVTPAVVGQHISLNPLVVFLAFVFGLWLWGPVGGIVALPALIWILVLSDVLRERPQPPAEEVVGVET